MKVVVNDPMWSEKRELISKEVVKYQWNALNDLIPEAEPSHAIKNFKIAAGIKDGEYYGQVFQDSDVYKWLEMAIYTLDYNYDQDVYDNIDYLISLIEMAQESSGYLNTYYQIVAPERKWTNLRDDHELYCAGHLLEAAVALKKVFDDERLLVVSEKFITLISKKFNMNNIKGYPGHQEIEIGLLRAYEITNKKLYLDLANYFIRERGKKPNYFEKEKVGRDPKHLIWNNEENLNFGLNFEYQQAHTTIENQEEVVGHAVRAVYYYTAVAKLLNHTKDPILKNKLDELWFDIINRKMYVTGAIGSNENGESFGKAYDLPNDTMYCETCASVGLTFFAHEMSKLTTNSEYAEIIEKVFFNSLLSGVNIDGDRFFYVNPLEVNDDKISDLRYSHVDMTRQKWLEVACCPPNLGRLIASIEKFIFQIKEQDLFVNQFIGSEIHFTNGEKLSMIAEHGKKFKLNIEIENVENIKRIFIRKPKWLDNYSLKENNNDINHEIQNGYIVISVNSNSKIELTGKVKVREVYSNNKVINNQNKVALSFGPYIYCLEQLDNEKDIFKIIVPEEVEFNLKRKEIGGKTHTIQYDSVEFDGYAFEDQESLYTQRKPTVDNIKCTAIPYYLWANREKSNMVVWINKEQTYTKNERGKSK